MVGVVKLENELWLEEIEENSDCLLLDIKEEEGIIVGVKFSRIVEERGLVRG